VKKKLAILASGTGSNARKILEHFKGNPQVEVVLIASNNPAAGVLSIAAEYGVPTYLLDKSNFKESDQFISALKAAQVDWVILAGFLWMVPENLIKSFPNKIVNIHPALLPKHGGKGMYGHFVHEAVVANHDAESGITIHFVNEHYDEGEIIFQARVPVIESDSALDVEAKVRKLEIEHFAIVIENLVCA
jgi:phosphoribosylglycinamide formyltransferase 1